MKVVKELNLQELIDEKLDDSEMWEFYWGKFKLGTAYCSLLRKDNKPSTSFYQSQLNGRIKLKDFSTGDIYGPVDFVKTLYNLTYPQALRKIVADFQLINTNSIDNTIKGQIKEHNKPIEPKKDKIIQITPRQWEFEDMAYWNSYGIMRIDTLKKFNVYPVEKLWINKKSISIHKQELCYAYYFPHTNHIKIYYPNRVDNKWLGNCSNETDTQGYYPLEIKKNKPELIIISKAMKDCLFFYERGIAAVAPHSEGAKINPDFIRHLNKYCGSVRSLFDKDESGKKGSEYLLKEFGIQPIEFPNFECNGIIQKDLTDCFRFCNREEVENFVKSIK